LKLKLAAQRVKRSTAIGQIGVPALSLAVWAKRLARGSVYREIPKTAKTRAKQSRVIWEAAGQNGRSGANSGSAVKVAVRGPRPGRDSASWELPEKRVAKDHFSNCRIATTNAKPTGRNGELSRLARKRATEDFGGGHVTARTVKSAIRAAFRSSRPWTKKFATSKLVKTVAKMIIRIVGLTSLSTLISVCYIQVTPESIALNPAQCSVFTQVCGCRGEVAANLAEGDSK